MSSTGLRAGGVPVVAKSTEEAAAHFGSFGMIVGKDQPASSTLTRELLGWQPTGPKLLADFEAKSGVDQAVLTKRIQDNVKIAVGRHAYPRIVDYITALPRTESVK